MKANDIVKAGLDYQTVTVKGVGEVELRGMTVAEAVKFSEKSKNTDDRIIMFAYLVKLCCPAFSGFWWTPNRIRKKLALKVILQLADQIMKLSGYGAGEVDEAVKN